MRTPAAAQPGSWNAKMVRSGYFLGALLLHLVVFLLVAAWVIFPAPVSPPAKFDPTFVKSAQIKPPAPVTMPTQPLLGAQSLPAAKVITIDQPAAISFTPPILPTPMTSSESLSLNANAGVGPSSAQSGDRARWEGIKTTVMKKWKRPLGNIEVTDGNPKNAVATFPVYLATYADGDWACNVHLKGKEIDAGSLPDLVAKVDEWSHGNLKGELAPIPLDIGSPDLLDKMPLFVFFTGHKDFVLTNAEVANLSAYLLRGGCIWGDNALPGRGSRFDVAFRREMKRVVRDSDKPFEPLAMTHDLFTTNRWFSFEELPQGMNYYREPLEHLDIDGKVAILYSPNDYGDLFWMRILPGDQAFAGGNPSGDSALFTNELFAFDQPNFFRNFTLPSCLAAQKLGMNIVGYLVVRFDQGLLLAP